MARSALRARAPPPPPRDRWHNALTCLPRHALRHTAGPVRVAFTSSVTATCSACSRTKRPRALLSSYLFLRMGLDKPELLVPRAPACSVLRAAGSDSFWCTERGQMCTDVYTGACALPPPSRAQSVYGKDGLECRRQRPFVDGGEPRVHLRHACTSVHHPAPAASTHVAHVARRAVHVGVAQRARYASAHLLSDTYVATRAACDGVVHRHRPTRRHAHGGLHLRLGLAEP